MDALTEEAAKKGAKLAALLRAYAARCADDVAHAREGVAVTVRRLSGFQNGAEAASGHRIVVDEPIAFGGFGQAADPAEMLLAAVGASFSVTLTAHAALRGLIIHSVELEISAEMDARSFLEPGGHFDAGLLKTKIVIGLRTSEDAAAVGALIDDAARASPVFNTLSNRPVLVLRVDRP